MLTTVSFVLTYDLDEYDVILGALNLNRSFQGEMKTGEGGVYKLFQSAVVIGIWVDIGESLSTPVAYTSPSDVSSKLWYCGTAHKKSE